MIMSRFLSYKLFDVLKYHMSFPISQLFRQLLGDGFNSVDIIVEAIAFVNFHSFFKLAFKLKIQSLLVLLQVDLPGVEVR